jgi:hypothetical protein
VLTAIVILVQAALPTNTMAPPLRQCCPRIGMQRGRHPRLAFSGRSLSRRYHRQLYRITLVGQPLVGIDGKPSRSIKGLPILSAAEELRMVAAE